MEAINLGVAATGPRQYHARIKNVVLGLDPDVVMAFIYIGNDMISIRYDDYALPPIIDGLPVPSMLGAVAPRTTWLLANRLGLSEVCRVNRDIFRRSRAAGGVGAAAFAGPGRPRRATHESPPLCKAQ
jgi:hypothetical protein